MDAKEYPHFTKEDCGEKMTQQQSREIQLQMLNTLADFCDKHDLRYFLSGGTLLGAVRHKGFIPWDDDIDINMPRSDCEKLMELTGGMLGKYIVSPPDMDGFARCCESYRLYDFSSLIESYSQGTTVKHPIYYPLFIDIFPIEGLPTAERATKLHYLKLVIARKMCRAAALKHMEGSNMAAHVFHLLMWVPAKLVGYKRWCKRIQKVAAKYSLEEQDWIGVMTAPVHTTNEKVLKKEYMMVTDVLFEGKYYHAPGNYDTYLTQLYGDYMKMPPVEKQKSHHVFVMYRNKTYKS